MIYLMYFIVAVIGYLIGSIPFGMILAKTFANKDIMQEGSGKMGMTNVLRTAGKKAAVMSLLLDLGKGALSAFIAMSIFGSSYVSGLAADATYIIYYAQALASLTAIAGHTWSIFLKFNGGRGVNTFLGGLLVMYWPAAIFGGGLMIVVGLISRYMSLGSIFGAIAAFIMLLCIFLARSHSPEYMTYTTYAMICSIFIFFVHRDNVSRLVSGTERRLGENTKSSEHPVSSQPE